MSKFERFFLPVGQGAFYFERFLIDEQRINLIFDCGSITNKRLVKKNINDHFGRGEIIDAVFVSHLHEDHVNGLEYLLKYCNVKRIFFPLLEPQHKTLLLLRYLSYNSKNSTEDFFYRLVDNPETFLHEHHLETKIFYIEPWKENLHDNDFRPENHIKSRQNITSCFDNQIIDLYKWKIIPFNFEHNERVAELITALSKLFKNKFPDANIVIDENFQLDQFWLKHKEIRQEIKEVYKTLKGDLNTNSMVIFSGTQIPLMQSPCPYACICNISRVACSCRYNIGCLYTGDYNCTGDNIHALKDAYHYYWDYIGCITIPHHGSKNNYNKDLTISKQVYYIISAKTTRNYNHPHKEVLYDMLNKGVQFFIVDDNPNYKVIATLR